MEVDAPKGLVALQDSASAAVLDEARFSEFVHEQIDPRACCANHLRQHLLRNRGNYLLRLVLFAIAREQQQSARQPLLDGVKEMVDEVFLDSFVSLQKISDEAVAKRVFFGERSNHLVFLSYEDGGRRSRTYRCRSNG